MKKIFGYVIGIVVALAAVGAIATRANASSNGAMAMSGITSNEAEMVYNTPMAAIETSNTSAKVMHHTATAKRTTLTKLASNKQMAPLGKYTKNNRTVKFQKARKGATVTLRNSKGQCAVIFTASKTGCVTEKLTSKQAKTLNRGGKYFTYKVTQKNYCAYTARYTICK